MNDELKVGFSRLDRHFTYYEIPTDRVIFEGRHYIDESGLDPATLELIRETAVNQLRDEICYHVKKEITTARGDGKAVAFPAEWWEAVKSRWAPAWFKKKYPVVYKMVTFVPHVCLPNYILQKSEFNNNFLILLKGETTAESTKVADVVVKSKITGDLNETQGDCTVYG